MADAVVPMTAGKAMSPDAGRLDGFCRVATDSVDEAAEQIGRIFCPHDLEPLRAASPGFFARHNCVAFNGFSINYVAYGGSVVIDPGCLERFLLVQIPLRGSARVPRATLDARLTLRRHCCHPRCRRRCCGRMIAPNSSCWWSASWSNSARPRWPARRCKRSNSIR